MKNKKLHNNIWGLIVVQSVILFFTGIIGVYAQVANYHFMQSHGTYAPLNNADTIALATSPIGVNGIDNVTLPVALPFPFTFNNTTYDTCYVVDNGFITFGDDTYNGAYPISSPNTVNGVIAAMGGDLWGVFVGSGSISNGSSTITNVSSFSGLSTGSLIVATGLPANTTVVSFDTAAGTIAVSALATATQTNASIRWGAGSIKTLVTGTSPNRKFIIEYRNFADNSTGIPNNTSFSFQIQLAETTNKIEVVYGPFVTNATMPRMNQIGLRGSTNNDFLNRSLVSGTWDSTIQGTMATAGVSRNNVNFPSEGLTFSWEPSTCFFPSGLQLSSISSTGFVLGWETPVLGNLPDGYAWELRTSGLPGSGPAGLISGDTSMGNNVTITGLMENTSYSIYLRTDCGSNNYSNWSPAMVVKTPCSAVQATPYLEDFSTFFSYLMPPDCWQSAKGALNVMTTFAAMPSTTFAWNPSYWQYDYTDKAALIGLEAGIQSEWLISPSIDIGTSGNKQVEFDLLIQDLADQNTFLGTDDTFALVISTDNGLTWSNSNILQAWTAVNTPLSGTHITIQLPTYSDTVKFGFYASEGVYDNAEKITINEFEVRDTPCFVVDLGQDITVCSDGTRTDTLDAGNLSGASYVWDDLTTGQTRVVDASGTYSVAVTRNGCTERDTINILYNLNPVSDLGNDTTLCGEDTFVVTASNAGDWVSWVLLFSYDNPLTITHSGTYIAEISDFNGCSTIDTIVVALIAQLPVVALGNDTLFCSGNTLTLDAGNPGLSNLWYDNTQTQDKVVDTSGTYYVTVTDNDGCIASDTINIQVLPSPILDLGNDTGICEGHQVVLDAGNAGLQHLWDDGSVGQTRVVDTTGQYAVSVTGTNSCSVTDTINIVFHALPRFDSISVSPFGPGTYNFSVYGAQDITGYNWDFGDGSVPGTTGDIMHQYDNNGIYTVILTASGSGDCGNYSDTLFVNVGTLDIDNKNKAGAAITLFPNPSRGVLQVKYPPYFERKKFAIYNVNGSKIDAGDFKANGMQSIDLSAFPSGTYCLVVMDEEREWPLYKFILSK